MKCPPQLLSPAVVCPAGLHFLLFCLVHACHYSFLLYVLFTISPRCWAGLCHHHVVVVIATAYGRHHVGVRHYSPAHQTDDSDCSSWLALLLTTTAGLTDAGSSIATVASQQTIMLCRGVEGHPARVLNNRSSTDDDDIIMMIFFNHNAVHFVVGVFWAALIHRYL